MQRALPHCRAANYQLGLFFGCWRRAFWLSRYRYNDTRSFGTHGRRSLQRFRAATDLLHILNYYVSAVVCYRRLSFSTCSAGGGGLALRNAAVDGAHACRWLQGARPTLLAQSEGSAAHVHLEGVRHPMLLQPCLAPLPHVPSPPAFVSDGSGSLSSDSDVDVTTSWRAMHTDSEYSGWMSADEDQKAREGSREDAESAVWPTALDLQVPAGARVVAVTGPNTGTLARIRCMHLVWGILAPSSSVSLLYLGVIQGQWLAYRCNCSI